MENLKAELGTILGEQLSRVEQIDDNPYAHLYTLYNQQGLSLPVVAKTYFCEGIAQQEAYKLSVLAREGTMRLPTVYGIVTLTQAPYQELLLLERMPGIYVEQPPNNPASWPLLMEQIVETLLAWHRVDSRGWVGMVDACQEGDWYLWYQQRVEVLWSALTCQRCEQLDHRDRSVLFRSRESLRQLFAGFDDNPVLVHGNLTLRSILKDPYSDQLVGIINPGMMLWAPREYDLFRLSVEGMPSQLLCSYMERAPVAESFISRRWLYIIWEIIARYLRTGQLDQEGFKMASQYLLPWLEK